MTKTLKILISLTVLSLLLVIGWQLINQTLSAEQVSESEIREKLADQYNGQIMDFVSMDEHYMADIEMEEGIYEVIVLKEDGEITDMRRVESFVEEEEQSRETAEKGENETPAQPITEEEARELALQEVEGTIDDIDYENDGEVPFYLVEIERENELEATVQIHALTREVMSVSWDD